MNGKQFLEALNSVDDKYINEFADIKPTKKRSYSFLKIASIAACVALVAVGSLALVNNLGSPAPEIPPVVATQTGESESSAPESAESDASVPPESSAAVSETSSDISQNIPNETSVDNSEEASKEPSTAPPEESAQIPNESGDTSDAPQSGEGEIIWGEPYDNPTIESFKPIIGQLIIDDFLKISMNRSDNPTDSFAVLIAEYSGATKEQIYSKFIKSLNIEEDYMKDDVIFLTESQILSLEPHEDLAIIICLKQKPILPEIIVTEDTLSSLPDSEALIIVLEIFESDEESNGNFVKECGLTDEEIIDFHKSSDIMTLKLYKDKVAKLLLNERVKRIIYHPDGMIYDTIC